MINPEDTAARGRYGQPIGWFEHEIDGWVHSRIRAATGQPALPPPPPPDHPRILKEAEVLRRTGISRVHRWRLEQVDKFPARIYLGGFSPRGS
jgi:predicted DNA-binding transcriptional regulator AlpA